MPEFHETGYGRKFFGAQLPQLIEALEMVGAELKGQRELMESMTKQGATSSLFSGSQETLVCPNGCGDTMAEIDNEEVYYELTTRTGKVDESGEFVGDEAEAETFAVTEFSCSECGLRFFR